jgi:glutamine synthetase
VQADVQIGKRAPEPDALLLAQPWEALTHSHPGIETLELILHDTHGIARGKWLPAASGGKVWSQPISLPRSIFAMDIWGREVVETGLHLDCGDIDGTCVPIPDTLALAAGSGGRSAQLLLTMFTGGEPCLYDPRQIAGQAISRLASRKLHPCVAFELEFYLVRESAEAGRAPVPLARATCGPAVQNMYGLDDLGAVAPFLASVNEAAEWQGVAADAMMSEAAPGQFEINLKHRTNALRAADEALLLKRIIMACARQHGFRASFMPKPFLDQAGSGMHVHVSLLDAAGRNALAQPGDGEALLKHCIAGAMAAMADAMLIFVPGYNGYRRVTPESYAPTGATWGHDNRSVAIRIPAGGGMGARRIEHRMPGADANPYLVLAALLHSMADGIDARLEPPPPVSGSAYAREHDPLPVSMRAAIERFSTSDFIKRNLGRPYQDMFEKVKRQELREFENRICDLEYQSYL